MGTAQRGIKGDQEAEGEVETLSGVYSNCFYEWEAGWWVVSQFEQFQLLWNLRAVPTEFVPGLRVIRSWKQRPRLLELDKEQAGVMSSGLVGVRCIYREAICYSEESKTQDRE